MRGKILCALCVVLVAACGVARPQEGDVSALLDRAKQCVADGNYPAAGAIYKQMAADYSGTEAGLDAQEKLIELYIDQGKQAEADSAFEQMVADFAGLEGLAKAVDHVADRYRELRNYEKAREIYRYAVQTWPDAKHAADSQRAIALTSILLGDEPNGQAAIDVLLSRYASNPDIVEVVDHLADDMRELKRYKQARGLYQYVVLSLIHI